jgi:hypothetical protein
MGGAAGAHGAADRGRCDAGALSRAAAHSLLLGSLAQTRRQRAAADLCLRPTLEQHGMLDTGHWAAIIDTGYRHAREALADFPAEP